MESEPRRKDSVNAEEEASLVRAAQAGDANAFTAIVQLHQHRVYVLVYGLTRVHEDADDLAQETFVRAWQALDRFRVGEPLYPWLARIARNLAYSLFRSRKRRPETSIEPLVEAGHQWGVDDDPAEHAAHEETQDKINAAFAELSEDHRAVLELRVLKDLSYEEIANTLGVPAGTVMSRLSRARTELRARLESASGGEDT
jgi:RNA polymerase sigma-70 factor (ECF subfamily)